jgi:hypothetical protein
VRAQAQRRSALPAASDGHRLATALPAAHRIRRDDADANLSIDGAKPFLSRRIHLG